MALTRYFHFRSGGTKAAPPEYMKHNNLCWKRVSGEQALQGTVLTDHETYYGFTSEEDCYNFVAPAPGSIPPCDEVVYHMRTDAVLLSTNSADNSFVDHMVLLSNNDVLANRVTIPVLDPSCTTTVFLLQPDSTDTTIYNKTAGLETMTTTTGTEIEIDSIDTYNGEPVLNFPDLSIGQIDVSKIGQAMQGTQDFTLEMWIKFDDVTKEHYVFYYDEPTRNRSYILLIYRGQLGPAKWQFTVNYGSGSTSASNVWRVFLLTEQVNLQNDTWHHVALVRNNVTDWRFYIDGVQHTHTPTSIDGNSYGSYGAAIDSFPGPLYIGTDYSGGNGFKLRSMRVSDQALYTSNSFTPTQDFASCVPGVNTCEFIKSSDSGNNWQNSTSITPAPTAMNFLYQQRGGSKYTYTCVNDNMLYRSINNGVSWSLVDTTAIDAETITSMNELSSGDLLMSYNTGDIFDETALLIQSNTTNVNDTVVDSSDHKHNVSIVGSGFHQPDKSFMSPSSLHFDGDYLSVAHSELFNLAGDDFTLEFWINFTTPPTTDTGSTGTVVMSHGDGPYSSCGWMIYGGNANHLSFHACGVGASSWNAGVQILNSIDTDRWYHVAIVRDSGTLTSYVDGVQSYQHTLNIPIKNQTVPLVIGWSNMSTRTKFNGYLQSVRLTKKAVYTSNFTPPGMFFGAYVSKSVDNAVSWQSVLSADSSDIVLSDSSKYIFASSPGKLLYRGSLDGDNWNSYAITENIGTIVESVYDRRLLAGTTEGASKMLVSIDHGITWSTRWETNSNYGTGSIMKITDKHYVSTLYDDATDYDRMLITSDAGDTWTPAMRTQDSLYRKTTIDHVYSSLYLPAENKMILGTGPECADVYTISNYTDPYADTSGFRRETVEVNNVYWTGNLATYNLTSYSGAYKDLCYYFNGVDSHMDIYLDQPLGTGDWCIECYVKIPADVVPTSCWRTIMSLGGYPRAGGVSLYSPRHTVGYENTTVAVLNAWRNNNNINDTIGHELEIVDGEWHHIALSKYNNDVTLYIDGRYDNKVQDTFDYTYKTLRVGHDPDCSNEGRFQGYMKDLRITRGSAVYPAPYYPYLPPQIHQPTCPPDIDTPPTIECQNRTLHLVASAENIGADLTGNYTPVYTGNVKASDTVELFNNKVFEFDGAGDYITIGSKADWRFLHDGTTDYTLEYWVRPRAFDGASGNNYYVNTGGTSNIAGLTNYIDSAGLIGFSAGRQVGGTTAIGAASQPGTIKLNQWQHVAFVFDSQRNEARLYVNGRLQDVQSQQNTYYTGDPHTALTVGRLWRDDVFVDYDVNGYMQDIRITKQCLYTGVLFEPPNNLDVPCV